MFPYGNHRPSDDVSLHIASHCFDLVGHTERRPSMKRSSYGERDYAFGRAMLTLRTTIGLTQAGLASQLHVSRRAVAEWEAGSAYPSTDHLKQLIMLGVQQQAFPAGREAEEIRALWHAAHQKLLLDEAWLAAPAAGGASRGRHERGLEPRWDAPGLWGWPGAGRGRGALRVGCSQRAARARLGGASGGGLCGGLGFQWRAGGQWRQ